MARFRPAVPAGPVLDLACGSGRHARLFLDHGYEVVAVDRDLTAIADIAAHPRMESVAADLEAGDWPLAGRLFSGIVVVNYLHRPLLPRLAASLAPGGVLIYQTFASGNEQYGRPRNPDFLLRPNELLDVYADTLEVIAYEHGAVDTPRPAVIQRICAVNRRGGAPLRLPPR